MPQRLIFVGPQVAASAPPQPPNGPYQQGPRPPVPGQRPGPPGQRPGPPGQRPGPPIPPYGPGGRGPGGPGGYPPQSGGDGGPFGSRRNLILAIVGGVVLIGAAIGIGFWLVKPGGSATPPPVGQVSAAARLPGHDAPPFDARHPVRIGVAVTVGDWRIDGAGRATGGSTAGPQSDRGADAHRRRRRRHPTALPGRCRKLRRPREAARSGREAGEPHAAARTGPPSSSWKTAPCT